MSDTVVTLTKTELQKLVEDAAEKGAANALKLVGLHDDDAAKDLVELRTLLDSWREVRKAALQTVGRVVMYSVLAALAGAGWLYAIKPH